MIGFEAQPPTIPTKVGGYNARKSTRSLLVTTQFGKVQRVSICSDVPNKIKLYKF